MSKSEWALPIAAESVFEKGLTWAVQSEKDFGNGDLIGALQAVGMAGPFRTTSPWEVEDEAGKRFVFAGGYAALPFGEKYPPLVAFIEEFLEKDRSMGFAQQSSATWRAALATNLVALLAKEAPSHADSQVFFSNSGAEAIECAMKFVKASRQKATHIINFTGAYHGKTYLPLSLTPNDEYQAMFRPLMGNVVTLPYGDAQKFVETINKLKPDNIVAVIVEPIQGEGGVILPPRDFLPTIHEQCRKHGILVVADEIQTGLGRTGHWFASLAGGLEPDVITLAKPLGGGIVPIGATIARKALYKKMLGGLGSKRHSNTFGGGSLAAAVGLKSLDLLVSENLCERAQERGKDGLARLEALQKQYPTLLDEVRGAGMLFALQLQPIAPGAGLLPPSIKELVSELGSILGLYGLYQEGIQANLSLSSKRVVRLTPALNIPDPLWEQLWSGVSAFAEHNPNAGKLLKNTPMKVLMDLAKIAAVK